MNHRHVMRRFSLRCLALIVLVAIPSRAATNVVTTLADSGPGSLRQVMSNSGSGDTIVFSTNGTIVLTSGELVIKTNLNIAGSGATNLAISGNATSRVFRVFASVTGSISGLTIRDGRTTNGPNASSSGATGKAGGDGGGIHNLGILTVTDCDFRGNTTGNGGRGSNGIRGTNGECVNPNFQLPPAPAGNGTVGGSGGKGGRGAALYNAGNLALIGCTFSANSTGNGGDGASGGAGGDGHGCGTGGDGGSGGGSGDGGALFNAGTAIVINCTFNANLVGAGGAGGAPGNAGVCCGSHCELVICRQGQPRGTGAGGSGAGVCSVSNITITGCSFTSNGNALLNGSSGGAIGNYHTLDLRNCTLTGNGSTYGGAVYLGGLTRLTMLSCTIVSNRASEGAGVRNAFYSGADVLIANSLFAFNRDDDVSGTFISQGHNLFAVGGSRFYYNTNGTGGDVIGNSSNPINPLIGSFANNGGPTLTHALLPGSPAIDAGDDTLVGTDQRGKPRRSGAHVDIGAFEFIAPTFASVQMLTNGAFNLTAMSDTPFSVVANPDVTEISNQWIHLGPATAIGPGVYEFTDTNLTYNPYRFYRLRWP